MPGGKSKYGDFYQRPGGAHHYVDRRELAGRGADRYDPSLQLGQPQRHDNIQQHVFDRASGVGTTSSSGSRNVVPLPHSRYDHDNFSSNRRREGKLASSSSPRVDENAYEQMNRQWAPHLQAGGQYQKEYQHREQQQQQQQRGRHRHPEEEEMHYNVFPISNRGGRKKRHKNSADKNDVWRMNTTGDKGKRQIESKSTAVPEDEDVHVGVNAERGRARGPRAGPLGNASVGARGDRPPLQPMSRTNAAEPLVPLPATLRHTSHTSSFFDPSNPSAYLAQSKAVGLSQLPVGRDNMMENKQSSLSSSSRQHQKERLQVLDEDNGNEDGSGDKKRSSQGKRPYVKDLQYVQHVNSKNS